MIYSSTIPNAITHAKCHFIHTDSMTQDRPLPQVTLLAAYFFKDIHVWPKTSQLKQYLEKHMCYERDKINNDINYE